MTCRDRAAQTRAWCGFLKGPPVTATKNDPDKPFWQRKTLCEMSPAEWESLCDGCGRCCLVKLEDEDTGEIHNTSLSCELLNTGTCRCTDYANRHARVDDCVKLDAENVTDLKWLPATCAYRLVAFGHDLPAWHHLICGDTERVHTKGPSMRGDLVSEDEVEWPE